MRCNVISPQKLSDQHLIAERSELLMIPALLVAAQQRNAVEDILLRIPSRLCLGWGHKLFWLDKFLYLEKRFEQLTYEMLRRNFKPNAQLRLKVNLAKDYGLYRDWKPTTADELLLLLRIKERLLLRFQWYRYYSSPITRDWFVQNYPF